VLLNEISQTRLVFADAEAARTCRLIDPGSPGRWLLFDPTLRVIGAWPLDQAEAALNAYANAPAPEQHAGGELTAPALIVPRIFEPDFCKVLIGYYRMHGGAASGVTAQDESGRSFVHLKDSFKRRSDCFIDKDQRLRDAVLQRL